MKTLGTLFAVIALFLVFSTGCKEDVEQIMYYDISGTVTYPDGNATGAVVYLAKNATAATTAYDLMTVADASGAYAFENLEVGSYFLFAEYNTSNTNSVGRYSGAVFTSGEGYLLEVKDADVAQALALESAGTAGVAVNNTAGGTWSLDAAHSEVFFEFPYDESNATFAGRFDAFTLEIDFDDANLAASSIKATVDLGSVATGAGGRDGNTGCVSRTFGVTRSVDTNGDGVVDNNDDIDAGTDVASFESTGFDYYGDGYVADGNLTFKGATKAVKVYFKFIQGFEGTNRSGVATQFSSLEATFDMAAKADFGIDSGHVGDADVTIYASYQVTKPL